MEQLGKWLITLRLGDFLYRILGKVNAARPRYAWPGVAVSCGFAADGEYRVGRVMVRDECAPYGRWMTRLYYADNLRVLGESIRDESVDLIQLDPPFNSNASYKVLFKGPQGELEF